MVDLRWIVQVRYKATGTHKKRGSLAAVPFSFVKLCSIGRGRAAVPDLRGRESAGSGGICPRGRHPVHRGEGVRPASAEIRRRRPADPGGIPGRGARWGSGSGSAAVRTIFRRSSTTISRANTFTSPATNPTSRRRACWPTPFRTGCATRSRRTS